MLDDVRQIMTEAGAIALRYYDGLAEKKVQFKSDADLVTEADKEVEQFLHDRLRARFPGAGFRGEEGTGDGHTGDRHFIVDPIDGTTSFVHGIPFFSISVALKEMGQTVLGAVYAPALDDFYAAERGKGARKNGQALRVSQTETLINALGATGFACVRQRVTPNNLALFNDAVFKLRGIRRLGSAALDLCLVAEGKFDLYWELNIMPWDIAAGVLIVEEAGGRVTDLEGGRAYETCHRVLATNGLLHDQFLALARAALED